MQVTKRNGSKEPIDIKKITKVIDWANEGLDCSVSQVELGAQIQFFEGMKTSDIHKTIVKSAADLISEEEPDYQLLAARLEMFGLRKEAYGDYPVPPLYEHLTLMAEAGLYDKHLVEDYSADEIHQLDNYLVHDRDLSFAYAAIQQFKGKYLVQDRTTGEVYESPQMAYMAIAMALFSKEKGDKRRDLVARLYDALSTFKISFPTPIMAGVRTPSRQFSSCVLIEVGDSLDSISEATKAIIKYVSQRAGIGLNTGAIRAIGSPIRNGEAEHTGKLPFLKLFQAAVKSCSQGGVRGGAATVFYPVWHLEFENLIVLKNNRGVEENRVRQLDYGVQLNKVMYERLIKGQDITFFSPSDVPGLLEAFYADQGKFEELYLQYEGDETIRKTTVPAVDVFSMIMQERAGTGRIYIQNIDHCNTHSPFDPVVAPVKQSNLCVAGHSTLLTDKGHLPIESLQGQTVSIWNGEEWSEVLVSKTGENQKLLRIELNDGRFLESTEYHKYYTQNAYHKAARREVRASDLKIGDKLIKLTTEAFEGKETLHNAYTQGFMSAEGCRYRGDDLIHVYWTKFECIKRLEEIKEVGRLSNGERITYVASNLKEKDFIPSCNYTIAARIEWLAGYLDGDGCVQRNGKNEAIVAVSTNHAFLKELQEMLQTLGVQAKVIDALPEGMRMMPANDGTGEYKNFWCQKTKRILISSTNLKKLIALGIKFNRLEVKGNVPQRDAQQFARVVSVTEVEGLHDTYCVNEPKRHMAVFNGILTGQCLEIALPTQPVMPDGEGEIALCTLSAFNLGLIKSNSELKNLAELQVRALDALLDYQHYLMPQAYNSTMKYRPLGIGVINYANYLAKRGLMYSDGSANGVTHRLFEAIQFYLLEASNKLAKEKYPCTGFANTRYAQGILPIDTYKKDVDSLHNEDLLLDWEGLRKEIVEHGLRNATLTALMPSETSSQISNATNGIEPPRSLVTVKQSKDGIMKQVVPGIGEIEYETYWQMARAGNKGYLELVAIMQKFVDQAISANTAYDPNQFPGGRVPMKLMLKDLMTAYKYGVKTLYYHNTRDDEVEDEDDGCAGGACKI